MYGHGDVFCHKIALWLGRSRLATRFLVYTEDNPSRCANRCMGIFVYKNVPFAYEKVKGLMEKEIIVLFWSLAQKSLRVHDDLQTHIRGGKSSYHMHCE